MRRYLVPATLTLVSLLLGSCAGPKSPYLNTDLTKEHWLSCIKTNIAGWTQGADRWFLAGDPNGTELANENAPDEAAISTAEVRVPEFTNLSIGGSFQVQIFGDDDQNAVFVTGPNEETGLAVIKVVNNTLYVQQRSNSNANLKHVIIRIAMRSIHKLEQTGSGSIEVVRMRSAGLTIKSSGCGNVFFSGNVNLTHVIQNGCGVITVFGANTPALDIDTAGSGSVNIQGNVGVQNIIHRGSSDINIVGANSDHLCIDASGTGVIGIHGPVNLTEVRARGKAHVFVDQTNSSTINIKAGDQSQVGIMGHTYQLNVRTYQVALFSGRYLYAVDAQASATGASHININASGKLFASASQNSTIYSFGPRHALSSFIKDSATIIPVG